MKLNYIKNIFYSLMMGISLYAIDVQANASNAGDNAPVPRTNRLINYTINAKRAEIIKKSPSLYKLVVSDSLKTVTYNSARRGSEQVNLDDFLDTWKRSGTANVEADVSGVQVNNKVFGHAQFYASVLLKKPRRTGNKVFFVLVPVSPLNISKNRVSFDNVTVFINGCNICNCGADNNFNESNCIVNR